MTPTPEQVRDNPCEKHLNVRASGYCPVCLSDAFERQRALLADCLSVSEFCYGLLREVNPGWGVAKDELNLLIHKLKGAIE